MRYRLFGQTGLRVSELFLGTMAFDDPGRRPAGSSTPTPRRAAMSSTPPPRTATGRASSARSSSSGATGSSSPRSTRCPRDPDRPQRRRQPPQEPRLSLERSLRRLRTDYIDIYWVHVWDRHTPIEETMRALDDAVRAGKILYVGISDAPAWVVARAQHLAEWRDWTPFAGLQVPYSLLHATSSGSCCRWPRRSG